jgi:uncharacterized protein YcbX
MVMSLRIKSLHIYPIKSCAGIDLPASPVGRSGLRHDRSWMVVTPNNVFTSQRTWPAMALIKTAIGEGVLRVDAPGMATLEVPLEAPATEAAPLSVRVWRDTVLAQPESGQAAAWFSQFLGQPCKLVRLHPRAERAAAADWVADWIAKNPDHVEGFERDHLFGFADGFPLLIANQASLDDLNAKLLAQGAAAVPMDRFRPNIVIEGMEAYEEDFTALVESGGVRMALVKPCTRCGIPNIDQADASVHDEPGITLMRYRSFDEGVVFGRNAIVHAPAGAELRVGAQASAELAF